MIVSSKHNELPGSGLSTYARTRWLLGPVVTAVALLSAPAQAETIIQALTRAYQNNPSLKAQRASVLATSENIERTRAGYRPKVNATADLGVVGEKYRPNPVGSALDLSRVPRGSGLELNQNLFDGFRTTNSVVQAKSQTLAARATLRNTEQVTLYAAVSAYLDVLTDGRILDFVRENVTTLRAQLTETQGRKSFGDATTTELAQIETRLAAATAQAKLAESIRKTSAANYRRIVGSMPGHLLPARAIDELIPSQLEEAVSLAVRDHPAVIAAQHGVAVALQQIRINRGELLPTVSLTARLQQRFDFNARGDSQVYASAFGSISVPLYEGGEVHARIRQAQHLAEQRDKEAHAVADEVRSAVTSAWGALQAARERVASVEAQIRAAETARNGVREEWRMGEKTLRELLDTEQDMLAARISLASIERERVLASYAVAQAVGRLSLSLLAQVQLNAKKRVVIAKQDSFTVPSSSRPPRAPDTSERSSRPCDPACMIAFEHWKLR